MATSPRPRLFERLEQRRRHLSMPLAVLAARSGVSLPTVQRILSGANQAASYANVEAIAQALDMRIEADANSDDQEFLEREARKKARRLIGLVQGTSALEGQAVNDDTLDEMLRKTTVELLAGGRRRLWGE